jgi:hypothetical protein
MKGKMKRCFPIYSRSIKDQEYLKAWEKVEGSQEFGLNLKDGSNKLF